MTSLLIALTSLLIGLILGYWHRKLFDKVTSIGSDLKIKGRTISSGVVKTEVAPTALADKAGVVKAKTPKEVAIDNAREFNNKYGL